ncbi:MAG: hypothetical protein AB7F59_01530 [Bdellovibrionales bacterium]
MKLLFIIFLLAAVVLFLDQKGYFDRTESETEARVSEITETAASTPPQPSVLTTVPTPSDRTQLKNLLRARLSQLNAALARVTNQQSHVDTVKNYIQALQTEIQSLQTFISDLGQRTFEVSEQEQFFLRQQKIQSDLAIVNLENQIQTVNQSIADLQAQMGRAPASIPEPTTTPNVTINSSLAQLQTYKEQIQSQMRTIEITSNIQSLEISNAAQEEKLALHSQLVEHDRRLADLNTDLLYWQRQLTASGNEQERLQRIQTLQTQIADLEKQLWAK